MNIDPFFVLILVYCCGLWALVGWELCRFTHKQRGIEVDRPVTDVFPPAPVVVPDTIPGWIEEQSDEAMPLR